VAGVAERFESGVAETIRRRGMDAFPPGPVLVAVSGGPDSLATMHVMHRLGYAIEVAHFDHKVRVESGDDAAFVRAQAKRLGVAFHEGERDATGPSPEHTLREARLAFLERTAAAAGAPRIATGHTLDDQAETVLMRVIAGAGRGGLGGIPPVRAPYIRPLIDRTRAETEAYCRALRLTPRRDATNDDPAYLRNAIRSDLLPHLASRYNARMAIALARTADILRDEDAVLDAIATGALQPEAAGGAVRLRIEDLQALHPALQRRALRRIAPLGAAQIERVRALAANAETGDELFLGQRLNARVEYGWLVLGPVPSPPARPEAAPIVVPGVTELPGWSARIRAVIVARSASALPDGVAACAVDAAASGDGLEVRSPRPGDRFRPLGMKGAKKLGDFFTDRKVPSTDRPGVPIVAGSRGIVWVVGHRIDDRAKVTSKTKDVLVLEWDGDR
jgi:tRNA(Ile)-lysidine synthase